MAGVEVTIEEGPVRAGVMATGAPVQAADATSVVRVRAVAVPNPQERVFGTALACALIVHAALIIGFTRAPVRQMGEKGGRPDGISVELVEAADLNSKNSVVTEGAPGIAGLPAPPPTKATPPPPEPKQEKSTPQPVPREAIELAPPPPEKAAKADASVPEEKKQETPLWPLDQQALDLVHPPERPPPAKSQQREAVAVPKPPAKPAQPQASQQLKIPDAPFLPSGGSTGFARPAGITRSGENDEFGRGVIRALRKTMPPARPEPAQVTVRFVLSDYGNLVELRLERSSGDPVIDQSVIFSVKQSSFPFPPVNAPIVDRTFLVTYVYR